MQQLSKLVTGRADPPTTVQQSIPYIEMHRDGICRVTDRLYTKTLAFSDVSYQLAQNEDKTAIFDAYCAFLNYFDCSVPFQLMFVNRRVDIAEFARSIDIPDRGDGFDHIRREYAGILKSQLSKGNNGLVKTKYVTFGVEADSLREAKPRLERVETDVIANFKTLGVPSQALDGLERLEVMHGQLNPNGLDKF